MLDELQRRALASSDDRGSWLTARSQGVTATEVAKLAGKYSGPAFTHELAATKLAGGQTVDLSHIPAVRHGQLREPVIAEWVEKRFGIRPNKTLFHALENTRHLATPDGVGLDFDEHVLTSEIKTSKHGLDPSDRQSYFWQSGYPDQIQWQHYVTGATRSVFAWEQHDDDWSGWPGRSPQVSAVRYTWIERDDFRIDHLVKVADEFLAYLDDLREGRRSTGPDAELVTLARQAHEAARLEREAKLYVSRTRVALETKLAAVGQNVSHEFEGGRISYSAPVEVETTEPDVQAAMAADGDLYARMLLAEEAWEEHLSRFTKPVVSLRPGRLQITPRKEK